LRTGLSKVGMNEKLVTIDDAIAKMAGAQPADPLPRAIRRGRRISPPAFSLPGHLGAQLKGLPPMVRVSPD